MNRTSLLAIAFAIILFVFSLTIYLLSNKKPVQLSEDQLWQASKPKMTVIVNEATPTP